MMHKRSSATFPQTSEITKMIRDDHRHILALFQLYLAAADDARHSIVDQILDQLASHLEREEELLYGEITKADDRGRRLVEEALLEHEEVKAMMHELRHSETDDDQALDEFFEDMMQTVRAHFIAEERDMLPLAGR
jgi:hemerythrin superfamily protein